MIIGASLSETHMMRSTGILSVCHAVCLYVRPHSVYRIARNFRGLKFSRFSRINDEPRKFYLSKFYLQLTYVARERNPRKLNRKKFGQGSSAKSLVLENF